MLGLFCLFTRRVLALNISGGGKCEATSGRNDFGVNAMNKLIFKLCHAVMLERCCLEHFDEIKNREYLVN